MLMVPKTPLGKWTIGFATLILIVLLTFFLYVLFDLVTFDAGHWWDITVAIVALGSIVVFVLSIIVLRKERSALVFIAMILSILIILFGLLHSLILSD